MRSVIGRAPLLGARVFRIAALVPLDLHPLRPETHRLADDLRAALLGDADLLLQDQPCLDDELLLEDRHDQHAILLAYRRCGFDGTSRGTRSTITSSCRRATSTS